MSKKELVLWLVFADFAALTVWAIYSEGLTGFVPAAWAFASGSAWGAQVIVDFLYGLAIALGFVIADARRRGLAWWPFLALTLTLGSIGPLAYLIFRERQGAHARVGAAAPQHA